jgi:dihydrodipicolinate synthase/N-acetylneuraminate lyase
MAEPFRGIFPALQATFDNHGDIDLESMGRQVAFNITCGCHGLVFPVMGGEVMFLSEAERRRFVEVVVGTASGQVPVVVGVSAPVTSIAVEYARHAARTGADGVIAIPAYPDAGSREYIHDYYRSIAEAAQMPLFVQHTGGSLNAALIAELIRDIDWARYVKEETSPSGHSITAALTAVDEHCHGVFGGASGQWMVPEMRRGAAGFVPHAHVTDIFVQVWDAFQGGDEAGARAIFECLEPMESLLGMVGQRLCKEVLVRRGVIATATMRQPGAAELDAYDWHEFDIAMRRMESYFRA